MSYNPADDELFVPVESEGIFTDETFSELTGGRGEDEEVVLLRSVYSADSTTQTFTNSSLVDYSKMSPCNSGHRTHDIDRITPHCVVGQCSVEALGDLFQNYERQTASNYGIGRDGRVGLYVNESDRSWCSSSNANDQRAITIECASAVDDPYAFYSIVYQKLVDLCVDICKRYGKKKLLWLKEKERTLAYEPKEDEMLLTVHRWFSPTKSCPGPWLFDRLGELADTVTAKLNENRTIYRVQIGSFSMKWRAESYAKKAAKKGFPTIIVQAHSNGKTLYRVQCGAFSVKENAESFAKSLKNAGFDAIITEDAQK